MPDDKLFPTSNAVERFYELNDDLDAIAAVHRRVFFKFLRTQPTLSVAEIDNLQAIADLLADLGIEKRQRVQ